MLERTALTSKKLMCNLLSGTDQMPLCCNPLSDVASGRAGVGQEGHWLSLANL